ncbi:MAG: ABC transporter permease [bacterium]
MDTTLKREAFETAPAFKGITSQETLFAVFWRRFRRNKLAIVGLVILGFLVASTLVTFASDFAGYLHYRYGDRHVIFSKMGYFLPYRPEAINLALSNAPPSWAHPAGTDEVGRDYLTRLIYGGRVSLSVGIIATFISIVIGTLLGSIAGYFGGQVDNLIMRFVDVMLVFPAFFLILTVNAILQKPNIYVVMLIIGLFSWMTIARIVRGEFLSLKEREFVEAARALGCGSLRIILLHIMPNVVALITVPATLGVAGAIITESVLSFIGVGVQPPTASWGTMLSSGQEFMFNGLWWLTIYPGLFIMFTCLALNFIGDAMRDAVDPKSLMNK